MPTRSRLAFAAALAFAGCGAAAAADDTISFAGSIFDPTPRKELRTFTPDRPTRATGPNTIDAGHVQVESDFANYSFSHTALTATGMFQALDPLIRYGLTPGIEIDVGPAGLLSSRTTDRTTGRVLSRDTGTGDTLLRAKLNLFGNDGGPAAFALVPYITAPSGGPFSAHQVQGGLLAPLNLSLPAEFSLLLMPEVDALANVNAPGTHAAFTNIVTLSRPVPGVKDLTVFAEFYASISTERRAPDTYTFDTALAYLVAPDLQLDLGANIGLNRDTPDYQVYTGVAHRF